jgi:hypothetical protein
LQPLLHDGASQRVEGAERLIEQQHVAFQHHSTQHCHALPHAVRKLGRIMILEAGEAERDEERPDEVARRLSANACQLKADRAVVDDAAPGHQRIALRHEGEMAAVGLPSAAPSKTISPPSGTSSPSTRAG